MEKQSLYLTPFQRKLLLKKQEDDLRPEYRRRIEIMLLADSGKSQAEICKALGCCLETARYWIVMAQTGKAHLWNERQIGRPKTVNQEYIARLKELVNHSPHQYGYPFQRWTAQWLAKHLTQELAIKVSSSHVNRLLNDMGLSLRTRDNGEKVTENAHNSSIKIQDLPPSSSPRFPFSMMRGLL